MARQPTLTTPFGRLAWDLFTEEIMSRMSELDDGFGLVLKGIIDTMDDDIAMVAESIDQDLELQAKIIERIELALAEVKAAQAGNPGPGGPGANTYGVVSDGE